MTEVVPAEEFRHLTGDEVEAALDTEDPANRIALEVYRLIDGYARTYAQAAQRLGYIPSHVLTVKPETAIEGIAMLLMTEALQKKLAKRI